MSTTEQLEALIHNPAERARSREINYAMVLSFLRNEPYSTAPVIADWLGMGVPGARRVLKQLVAKELVIADEISWMKTRKLQIFAASTIGRYQYMNQYDKGLADLEPPSRDYVRGRVKLSMLEHTLMIQTCRVRFMRAAIDRFLDDEDDLVEPALWMAESQMPGQHESRVSGRRWPVYPDGIFSEVMVDEDGQTYRWRTAVEAERTRKSKNRYAQILKAHRQNIAADRYDGVCYCVESDSMNSYDRTFRDIDADYEAYLDVASVD